MIEFLKKSGSRSARCFAFLFVLIQLTALTATTASARPIKIPPPPPPPVQDPVGAIISVLESLLLP